MTEPYHNTTHVADAIRRMLSTVRIEDPNLVELVEILADLIQDFEDLCWDCIAERYVTTAVGVQLDTWGRVLGLDRNGLSDTVYQRALLVWQGALRSQGIRDNIIRAVVGLVEPAEIRYIDRRPATYEIDIYTATPPFDAELMDVLLIVLEAASPSGVAYMVVEAEVGVSFRFDDATRGLDLGKMGRRVV